MSIVYDPFATVPFSAFSPEVILATGNCPAEIAENYLRHAAIDLAERSQIITRIMRVDFQACVSDYLITPPACERIVAIQRVCFDCSCNDNVVTPHEPCRLPCACGNSAVWFEPPDIINVTPAPASDYDGGLWVKVSVAPLRDACEVDRLFYERYHEAVVHGALARLFAIKKAEWYDPQLATLHTGQFDDKVTGAGMDRLTGNTRGPFRMKHRRVV
jgi:hypothetical protein